MHSKLVRTPGVYLVGFMGCGKTTVGQLLGDELGWTFADLDDDIEAAAGCSIAEFFAQHGEAEFRKMEHSLLQQRVRKVQYGQPTVLSLGGGAYAQPDNVCMLADNGVSIWLDCPFEIILRRIAGQIHRPLAQDLAKFEELFHSRKAAYAQAEFHVEITADDPKLALNDIMKLPHLF
ncbi:MAG: shikimate kinase [Acidobacteriia bacterium]|nr:shikimate kinase [Terriglobia bacterium]